MDSRSISHSVCSSICQNYLKMLAASYFDCCWWALSFPPKMFLKSLWFYPGWGKIMPKGGQKCPSVLKNDLMMLADISRLVLISTIFSVTTFLTPHWHSEPGKNMPKYGQNVKKRSNMLKIILWCWFLPCWWLLSFTLDFFYFLQPSIDGVKTYQIKNKIV